MWATSQTGNVTQSVMGSRRSWLFCRYVMLCPPVLLLYPTQGTAVWTSSAGCLWTAGPSRTWWGSGSWSWPTRASGPATSPDSYGSVTAVSAKSSAGKRGDPRPPETLCVSNINLLYSCYSIRAPSSISASVIAYTGRSFFISLSLFLFFPLFFFSLSAAVSLLVSL